MLRIFILILLVFSTQISNAASTTLLKAVEVPLTVNAKKTKVFDIIQPDGKQGFYGVKGQYFDVTLKNATTVPISIHWHGLVLPNDQDGVPYVTQLPIQPGGSHHYHFKLLQAGTFWMHSHFGFHEQELMTAPLIVNDPHDPYANDKDVVVMLQGFTFKNPKNIFYDLQHRGMAMEMSSQPDLNDVKYDALLANRRTLQNPEIITVKAAQKIRLRLINASSASNLWIKTGKLNATAIAVDGNNIEPLIKNSFQIADAQRIDLEVTIPEKGGAFPILAQIEGTKQQAGVILVTTGTQIPRISELAEKAAPALNDSQEFQLHPLQHLTEKPVSQSLNYALSGDMQKYIWKINNQAWPLITPNTIKKGDRVEMVFTNDTNMAHPMHFHGHVFQVTEIDGKKLQNGPLRDTILILPHSQEKIIFDAENPGIWVMHCHVLYHMIAGMMTTANYLDYPEPEYYQQLIKGKIAGH